MHANTKGNSHSRFKDTVQNSVLNQVTKKFCEAEMRATCYTHFVGAR